MNMPEVSRPEVGVEDVAVGLTQARFWVTSGLPTIHRLGLTLQRSFSVSDAAADVDDLAQRAIWKWFGTNVLLV